MKRTFAISILASVLAALLPLAAASQDQLFHRIHRPRPAAPAAEGDEPNYKYEVYAGYGYTSLNQVNQSRSGLSGGTFAFTRDWGKYFGLTAEGGFYKYPFTKPVVANSTITPSVDSVLFGPVLHAQLYEHTSGFFHVLLGGEHTGGTSQTPNISFAGGVGGGIDYKLTRRIFVRASGDVILQSFSVTGNSSQLGYSPHETRNARASLGVVYRF